MALLSLAFVAASSKEMFLGENQKSGLVKFANGDDMFYWLFNSRSAPAEDPLVIWLTGGPGCSSELGLFFENGPFKVNEDLSLRRNAYSWNSNASVVYIDNPVGVGFSKITDKSHYDTNEDMIAEGLYNFMLGFLEQNPSFKGRRLYITGESYAGHYVPAVGAYFAKKANPEVNIQGVAIGNGWTNPKLQYPEYNNFAYENEMISAVQYYMLKPVWYGCQFLINNKVNDLAFQYCQYVTNYIVENSNNPKVNIYDIRIDCNPPPMCYNLSNIDTYLNLPEVKEALGVPNRSWAECDGPVQEHMLGDWIDSMSSKVAYLLENKKDVLVYSGDKDYICNWRGGEAWTKSLEWAGKASFGDASYQEWLVDGKSAGQTKFYENFRFLRVYDAGHQVPYDQPKAALTMLNSFMAGKL